MKSAGRRSLLAAADTVEVEVTAEAKAEAEAEAEEVAEPAVIGSVTRMWIIESAIVGMATRELSDLVAL
jgi:hypothetical protein